MFSVYIPPEFNEMNYLVDEYTNSEIQANFWREKLVQLCSEQNESKDRRSHRVDPLIPDFVNEKKYGKLSKKGG